MPLPLPPLRETDRAERMGRGRRGREASPLCCSAWLLLLPHPPGPEAFPAFQAHVSVPVARQCAEVCVGKHGESPGKHGEVTGRKPTRMNKFRGFSCVSPLFFFWEVGRWGEEFPAEVKKREEERRGDERVLPKACARCLPSCKSAKCKPVLSLSQPASKCTKCSTKCKQVQSSPSLPLPSKCKSSLPPT